MLANTVVFLPLLAAVACANADAGGVFGTFADARPAPKYIITVLMDDYGWHNIFYHNNNITSPNLAELADEGVTLDRHYV